MRVVSIDVHRVGAVPVVRVGGDLDIATVAQLRTQLLDLADERPPAVVVDLSEVTFLDSTGIGVLIGARRRLLRLGSDLLLASPSPAADLTLRAVGLLRVLATYETAEAALADRGLDAADGD